MGTESIDYMAALADLEAKKAALEDAIRAVRLAIGIGALGQIGEGGIVPSLASPSLAGGEVPTGAFLGKSIIEAARLYLEIVKKKQTAKEIMEGLVKGGMESSSKSFLKTVHASLTRARQAKNPLFVKVGIQYGLTSWFPKGVASGGSTQKKGKKKVAKAAAKTHATARPSTSKPQASKKPIAASEDRGATAKPLSPNMKRVSDLVQMNPKHEFTLHEIAKDTNIDVQNVNRLVINLARGHKVERTADGKVRAVILAPPANGHAVA